MDEGRDNCVLVVEDDRDTLAAMLRLLTGSGFPTFGVTSLQSARDAFARERCRLLVCDLLLKDGSGLDLMRELAPHGVRGIAVSGCIEYDNKRASLDAGFSAHITKPVLFPELLKELHHLASV